MSVGNKTRRVGRGQLATMLGAFLTASVLAGIVGSGLLIPVAGGIGVVTKAGTAIFDDLPEELELPAPSAQSEMYASDGSLLARFYAENRIVVPLSKISKNIQKAAISIEDRRFYAHHGVDLEGLARAAVNNLAGGGTQGASTLTQQYVKNSLIESGLQAGDVNLIRAAREQTLGRKVREARYALAIEKHLSKDDILAGYLNIAPFGPSVYGVEAASQYYFSKSAANLTVAESALLAGITQSPKNLNPIDNPESALNRRNAVLSAMLRDGSITAKEHKEAIAIPIKAMLKVKESSRGCASAGSAAFFCSYVLSDLYTSNTLGKNITERRNRLLRGGFKLYTSLDPKIQKAAKDAIEGAVPTNDPSKANMAIVAVEPGTGRIRAIAQNTNFGAPSASDPMATETSYGVDKAHGGGANGFQTGSSFKAFTLAQWFKEGRSGTQVVGTRTTFPASSWHIRCKPGYGDNYSPRNLGNLSPMPVTTAAQLSSNPGFVDMANRMDLCDIMQTAADLGVTQANGSPVEPFPANIIGSASSTPLAMANAYAAFAADGKYCTPMAVDSMKDRDGKNIPITKSSCSQKLDATAAAKVNTVLKGVVGHYSGKMGGVSHDAGGKTGTTNDFGAAWMVGYTSQLSAAVWMGHGRGLSSLAPGTIGGRYYPSMYGITLSAPTWRVFMNEAMSGVPNKALSTASLDGKVDADAAAYANKQQDDKKKAEDAKKKEEEDKRDN